MKTYKKLAIAGSIVAAIGLMGIALPSGNATVQRGDERVFTRGDGYGMMRRSSRFDVRSGGCCEGRYGTIPSDDRNASNLDPADLKETLVAEATQAGYYVEQIYVLEGTLSLAHLHDSDHESHLVWIDNQSGEVVRSLQGRRMMHDDGFYEAKTVEVATQQAQKWLDEQASDARLGATYSLENGFAFEVKTDSEVAGILLVENKGQTFFSFQERLVSVLVIDNK
ncbi:MAG: hypothetical protein ACRDBX_03565 [Erysipelotrichaceae bacterium]